jgi:hypothetical protein
MSGYRNNNTGGDSDLRFEPIPEYRLLAAFSRLLRVASESSNLA